MTRPDILNSINAHLYRFNWAINKDTDEVVCCDTISCTQCKFYDAHKNFIGCSTVRMQYLDDTDY